MRIGNITGDWILEDGAGNKSSKDNEKSYISINKDKTGSFQFGAITGVFKGKNYKYPGKSERFEFTWEGASSFEKMFGYCWLQRISIGRIEGEIRIHRGGEFFFEVEKMGFKKSLEVFNISNREERIGKIIKNPGLAVTTRTLKNYLKFIKENIELPFLVTGIDSSFTYSDYKERTPDGNEKFEIVEFEEDVKNCSNLFVKVKRLSKEGGVFSLQLFEFKAVRKHTIESKILKDYSYWIKNHL